MNKINKSSDNGQKWLVRVGMFSCFIYVFLLTACMTPEKATRESDVTGMRLATEYWQKQTGSTNDFDISRPADALTLRIALMATTGGVQNVVFPKIPSIDIQTTSNGVLCLSLTDALCVAARNDRKYQKLKEDVFSCALEMDYQQYAFETSFSGIMLAALSGDFGLNQASGEAAVGARRTLPNGTAIAGRLALDIVSLLREDWRSVAFSGDFTVTVPLMRGAGREIVMEPLTQAERNLVYAIRIFEYYRQTYAVTVVKGYFRALELEQQFKNAKDNEQTLAENNRRAEMMFEAGRMQRIQVDQSRTDFLMASEGVIAAHRNRKVQLDIFKMIMGLPPEGNIMLKSDELTRLEDQMKRAVLEQSNPLAGFPDEDEACRIALTERHDLFITRSQCEDAARDVRIAEDALRADVALSGTLAADRQRATGAGQFSGNETWTGGVRAGFPWDRRKERNEFRKRMIILDQAKRTVEEQEDGVKQAIRQGFLSLVAAHAGYKNQVESMKVAKIRVESNNLFLQSGRSTMRDILEAESALLRTRNALCSAVIQWCICELELRRDMGVLKMSNMGEWLEVNRRKHD